MIAKAIGKIADSMQGFASEIEALNRYQAYTLDKLKPQDFSSLKNQQIIRDIRNHKGKIEDVNSRLKELEDMLVDLDNKLTQQDIHNATKLLAKKSNKLRERLTAAKEMFEKITACGNEMDGNTSTNEEEDFVEMLKDQMPEMLGNIDENFEQIDKIDQLLN
jgi:hypothetical protein